MSDPVHDDRLRGLLSDAVSDIEPENRLDELRASVHPSPRVVPMSRPRSWYAAAGIVATAAVIGIVAYLTSVAGEKATDLGPATDSGTAVPSATATDPAATQGPGSSTRAQARPLAVYFLGHGPQGDVLYRETVPLSSGERPLDLAVSALMDRPTDPDYRTGWYPGTLVSASAKHGVVRVELGPIPAGRPTSMSQRTAYETVQQAVYTLQGATGRRDIKVQFLRHGKPAPTILGVPTTHPVGPGRAGDVLSKINIGEPLEGQLVQAGRLVVSGTNNGVKGRLSIRLVRKSSSGENTVLTRSGAADGFGKRDRMYPWRVVLDTSDLPPGAYTLMATNDDPGGRGDPATDTRVVVLR
ncbi:GerMN domain-containing protein [Nocardioides sp.]|jgi:hypothetical protein|uniref:GerMN domain-containing protein n=1 Tax=Nocardioides sp. TaxID=35761 RepID=UPI002F42C91D